ncbi:MAG: hypothetical protein A3I89_00550 [Candidatus Harrisonbacteria bacterium RIFCSPLOWO2_02_FULL_41_11]|uniref:Type 4 fimbrial biogenesis protein PilO n=1 Tax=Candidatus Harrisonbacteria bacterium RIFCSPHIGHO2_02_FULL_42_16 TaxID=1798404 RepID=A0A1G1ZHA2_9BACT|nr:MAG: hypothetical protein A3B92_02355 [Candidatus Harrisonbacteria bacterium RIFCSPHIGHO2_02_FULL_42_16]OGY66486.1 MAG: hypothetical protein A3I89_00550 [Candidatus Harrisonbacteria bacterium RIFCSPLOWO2_02_FULL_41_11]
MGLLYQVTIIERFIIVQLKHKIKMEFRHWLLKNLGVSAVVFLALAGFIILSGRDISGKAAIIQVRRQEVAQRLKALESLALLRADAKQAEKLLEKLHSALPAKDQLIKFSKNLESFAKKNGLGFGFAFESETKSTETMPGANNFVVTVSGNYENFTKFLKLIEQSDYFVNFESFNLLSEGDKKGYAATLRGKVFSQ